MNLKRRSKAGSILVFVLVLIVLLSVVATRLMQETVQELRYVSQQHYRDNLRIHAYSVLDLAGKRVSLDEPGSGTYVDANLILEANGLSAGDIKAEALKGGAASEALRNGKIDAFFVVAGYPTGSLVELASAADIKLVPIAGQGADALTEKYGFFASSDIPADTYEGVEATKTVAVGAQWYTSAKEDEELIYNITKALWNDETRKLLDVGHAKGKTITTSSALNGIGVPLHAGAERFYKEAGLLK